MTKFVQVHRAVEAHSECILFVYLLDENGNPVPNVKMRIWAGPPPWGQPPYFEDSEPDNFNRRTDSNGKFQFIVANPAPTQPLDFFVQAIGPDDAPQSEPIHFPFPPHEARWMIITMAPEIANAVEDDRAAGAPVPQLDRQLELKAGPVVTHSGSDPVNSSTALAATNNATFAVALPSKLQTSRKVFSHYLLLGSGSQPETLTNLIIALDYILRYAPLVGFSTSEAKYAEHVTILGDTAALSSAQEQSLREAGCAVTRLTASDSYALEIVLKQLIDSGSPYPT